MSNWAEPLVFGLGFPHKEPRLSDQDENSPGSSDVGEALATGCRRAVATKQVRNRITKSCVVDRWRKAINGVSFVENGTL